MQLPLDGIIGFQSTLSMRRATDTNVRPADWSTFQSTLSMRRASEKEGDFDTVGISIHALHEESDRPQ